jgi:hypothetical protein
MADWKDIIKTVAPSLAGLLGGPLAATAVGALSQALLGKNNGTMDEIAAVVSSGNPEILLKIKQTETELKTKLLDAGVKLEEIDAGDRDSARKREVDTKDNTTKILAYLFSAGYFCLILGLAKWGLPPDSREMMVSLISILSAAMIGIVNYYFGSSAGSARTREILGKVTNGK